MDRALLLYRLSILIFIILAAVAWGCSSEVANPGTGTGGAGGSAGAGAGGAGGGGGGGTGGGSEWGFEQLTIEWAPCSLHDGEDDGLAECAEVALPLRWGTADGQVFRTYAKRLLSAAADSEGQLWLLHGGPGGSGTVDLPRMMAALQADYPELDLYTLDARGTGYSEWLGCPEQESAASDQGSWISLAELDACIAHVQAEHGDKLDVYTPTSAAIDLAAFIYLTREPGKKVLIWGGSGGTFWAQRYLQLFPAGADGIVLEGIVPPDTSLVFQDEYDDKIARAILELCTQDAVCASKLPDPVATLTALYDKIDGGHCAALGLDTTGVKAFIRAFDYYYPTYLFMPAFIYRMDRCNPQDMNAIYNIYMAIWGTPEKPHSFSNVLFFNEAWSELWEHHSFADNDALLAYLDTVGEAGLITHGMGQERNEYYLRWPKYTDALDDEWASSAVPLLMLQGQIDPSTPHDFAATVGQHFAGPHQQFVAFPYAPHNVASGTPLTSDPAGPHCGRQLFVEFLKDPEGDLDTSCVSAALPPDFEGTAWAPLLTGTADFFENDPPPPPTAGGSGSSQQPSPGLEQVLSSLARRLGRYAPPL